ncbi:phosphatase PAP2 family protein, partial [Candidatus Woesearchaeota archaeon]|nr:phosphatase PAP2 family protein [Candidatus Woesearchaeota archaeon]
FVFLFFFSISEVDFGIRILLTSIVFLVIEYLAKMLTKETRPDFKTNKEKSLIGKFEEKHSFPSGHCGYIALLTTMLNLHYHNVLLTSLFTAITISVGFSRIYTKRHYFNDVVGGYVVGITLGILSFLIFP